MVTTDVQLKVKTVTLTNGTTRNNLVGFVLGRKAYVPDCNSVAEFIADVNAGRRDLTGISEGKEVSNWTNPKTGLVEPFVGTSSCVWGTTSPVQTAAQALEYQKKMDALLARKEGRDTSAPVVDYVQADLQAVTARREAIRAKLAQAAELEAQKQLAAAGANTEPVLP